MTEEVKPTRLYELMIKYNEPGWVIMHAVAKDEEEAHKIASHLLTDKNDVEFTDTIDRGPYVHNRDKLEVATTDDLETPSEVDPTKLN